MYEVNHSKSTRKITAITVWSGHPKLFGLLHDEQQADDVHQSNYSVNVTSLNILLEDIDKSS